MRTNVNFGNILQPLLVFYLLFCIGCGLKDKGDFPDREKSPIDGVWRYEKLTKEKYRIEKGKLYVLQSPVAAYGKVLAFDIERKRPREYSCTNGALMDNKAAIRDCMIEVIDSKQLLVRFGKKNEAVDVVLQLDSPDNEDWFLRDFNEDRIAKSTDSSVDSIKVKINPRQSREEASSEEVLIPAGVILTITRSRTVEHRLSFGLGSESQVSVEAKLLPLLEGSIRAEISATLGKEFKASETVEHKIALDGSRATRYRLIWYDKWRTGSALLNTAEGSRDIPFRFREWEDLEIVALSH